MLGVPREREGASGMTDELQENFDNAMSLNLELEARITALESHRDALLTALKQIAERPVSVLGHAAAVQIAQAAITQAEAR